MARAITATRFSGRSQLIENPQIFLPMAAHGRQPSLASVESVKFEGRGTFVPGLLGAIGQGNVGACRDGGIKVDRPSGVIG